MFIAGGGYKVDSVFYDRVTVFDKICLQRDMKEVTVKKRWIVGFRRQNPKDSQIRMAGQ